MSDASAQGPPAWLPASVGRAYARGTATREDLHSGAAWREMVDALQRADAFVRSDRSPSTDVERGGGYRHLLVLLAIGIDEALRRGDPYDPRFAPGTTDAVLKWGMDCPDALYLGTPVRGDATYRITGSRGSVRYLGLQVMSGIATAANVVADELATDEDGQFSLALSADERPGNWMPLAADATSLVVRQFFYDWENEEPARLRIELERSANRSRDPEPLDPAGVARQMVALGSFVEESLTFWSALHEQLRSRGVNAFATPDARTDLGGAAENVTVWGSWEIADDEVLIVEVTPPDAIYWSIALGNHWWESIDYTNHQSSLNGHQAVLDADGAFRAVIAQRDPGVANWLDPAGNREGAMIVRYVRASDAPVPETRLLRAAELTGAMPSGTARVDPVARSAAIASRRAGARKRFPR